MSAEWPWSTLDLEGPTEERAVKRAYAARLKAMDRSDTEAVQALRRAYDKARELSRDRTAEPAQSRPQIRELGQAASRTPAPRTPAPRPPAPPVDPVEPKSEAPVVPAERVRLQNAAEPETTAPLETEALSAPLTEARKTRKARNERLTSASNAVFDADADAEEEALETAVRSMRDILARRQKLVGADLAELRAVFERVSLLDRPRITQFETTLAQTLLRVNTRLDKQLATAIDDAFYWISDAAGTEARLRRVEGSFELLVRLGGTFQKKERFGWLPFRIVTDPPMTLEEIMSLTVLILAVLNGILQFAYGVWDPDFGVLVSLISSLIAVVATFIGIVIAAVLVEWFVLWPLKRLGISKALLWVFSRIASANLQRRVAARKPGMHGISLLIVTGIVLLWASVRLF